MKKIISLCLAFLLLSCAALTGCGGSGETEYRVTVQDYAGEPITSGIIAVFSQNGEQVAMQACGETGEAVKTLPTGEYTVSFQSVGGAAYYAGASELTVTGKSPKLTATLYPEAAEQVTVNVPHPEVDEESGLTFTHTEATEVCKLSDGCTWLELTPGDKTYFLFTPTQGGTYQFSVEVGGDQCVLGYYGSPHYIRETMIYEPDENGATTMSIENNSVTGDESSTLRLVFAVETETAESCVVRIQRVGDPEWNVSQEEWIIYETTADLTLCDLPEGTQLTNFDLTQSYDIVYSSADQFYHVGSADGPVVYVWLTQDPRFVDCFETILDEGTVRAYFYDDEGNFLKKEAYGNCLREYFEYADEEYGVYPLTDDLMYIIQCYGEHAGWWDSSSAGFMIDVEGLNTDSAWLFMCCYAQ